MSVQLAAQDFTTPSKGGGFPLSTMSSTTTKPFIKSVTPAETTSSSTAKVTPQLTSAAMNAAAGGKQVRFGVTEGEETTKEGSSDAGSTNNKRGLVSRRGGRYVSPGRPAEQAPFRAKAADSDTTTTPALVSTNSSVGIVSLPSAEAPADSKQEEARPSSISCAASMEITSPLASKTSPHKDAALSFDDADSKSYVRSPVPSTLSSDRFKKTPTKSPSHFHSLPSLDDSKLNSPVGFILSPGGGGPNTPSYKTMRDAFEKENNNNNKDDTNSLSEKIRDYTKEKFALTPTNFANDYGKAGSTTFDTSNVLNWLQSPTANGLFSPGGLNSIMNTPKGPLVPRTPGTPVLSTSFFFSDVAGLPKGDTPKRDSETAKSPKKGLSNIICISPLASSRHRGTANAANTPINYNDIFASPNPLLEDSPVPTKAGLLKRPSGGKKGSNPSLDAMSNAERDLMQDEDLSVLLQLAGGNTPRGAVSGKAPHVFRAGSRKGEDPNDRENLPGLQLPIIGDREGDSSATRLARKSSHARGDSTDKDTFVKPTLGIRKSSKAGDNDLFAQKENTEHPGKAYANEPTPNHVSSKSTIGKPLTTGAHPYPHYPPRPPTSDLYSGYAALPPHGMRPSGRMSVVVGGPPPSSRATKSNPAPRPHLTPSHRRPSYSSQESYPPPPSGGISYPPPHHGHYPPPHPPPHMGIGAHPYHGHYAPPPRHHAPPPSHMPMYGAQQQQHHSTSKITPSKKSKASKAAKQQQAKQQQAAKQHHHHQPQRHHLPPPPAPAPAPPPPAPAPAPAKRPSIGSDSGKPTKKAKKAAASKKKNKSPQLTEKADRQRAAANIAAVNAASGGKNDKAAALAAAILRGVTMRPSGKWQAQLYFAGKSRYIGVFDTREKAALAYEIAREKLKSEKSAADGALTPKQTENAVNAARRAAFEGVGAAK